MPIQGLTIGINYDGPYIPEFEYVDFTGSPEIATTEGSATKRIIVVEFKSDTKVGSATFSAGPFSYDGTFDLGTTPGKYHIVAFGHFSGKFDAYTGSAFLTQIAGTLIGQPMTDVQSIKPFAGVTVTDAPPTSTGDDNDILSITSTSLASGVLSDPNQATDGGHSVGDAYVLLRMGAALTKDVDSLVFTPTEHQTTTGKSVTTTFTLTSQNLNEFGTTTELASVVARASSATDVTYVTGPAAGHALLTGTNGADDITVRGADNVILAKGGNDVIDAGDGGAIVQASGGNKNIALGGALNLVIGGDGNDVVYGAPGGKTAITLGSGDDVVDLGGNSNYVLLSNGNDRVFVSGGMSFISTGAGVNDVTVDGSKHYQRGCGGLTTCRNRLP